MSKKDVIHEPHRVLRTQAEVIPEKDILTNRIQRLIANMKDTLAVARDGIGLAAPQVGVSLRIFVVSEEASKLDIHTSRDMNDSNRKKEWDYFVFINPVVKKQSKNKITMAEGCLSLPGKFGEVVRAEKVFLEWRDERGKKHGRGFTRFFARVIQHELDHLDGILISHRVNKLIAMPKEGSVNDG